MSSQAYEHTSLPILLTSLTSPRLTLPFPIDASMFTQLEAARGLSSRELQAARRDLEDAGTYPHPHISTLIHRSLFHSPHRQDKA